MRRIAAVAITLLSLSSVAHSADFQGSPPSSGQWTGGYAGLHIGLSMGQIRGDDTRWGGGIREQDTMKGFSAGALAGWNIEMNQWILGVEGDVSFSGTKGDTLVVGANVTEKSHWDAHLRGRAGYLITPDILAFAAGGLALSDLEIKTDNPVAGNDRDVMVGWTIGAGVEANLSDGIRGRLEYLYDDYSQKTMFPSVGNVDIDMNRHTVRAALIFDLDKTFGNEAR